MGLTEEDYKLFREFLNFWLLSWHRRYARSLAPSLHDDVLAATVSLCGGTPKLNERNDMQHNR